MLLRRRMVGQDMATGAPRGRGKGDIMAMIKWDPTLSVGVDVIDEQHKTWIKHLNSIEAAIETRQGPDKIAETLHFMVDYVHVHFAAEEKLMASQKYPDAREHEAKHAELRATLDGMEQDFREDGATHTLAEAVGHTLSNWLRDHIHNVDQKLGTFLRQKGATD